MDLTPAVFPAQARELVRQMVARAVGEEMAADWYDHPNPSPDVAEVRRLADTIAAALGAVCDAARAESAKKLAQERWQHAACLSIAEGAPGWKEVSQRETSSVAMRVVGNLRTAYLERVEEVRQLQMQHENRNLVEAERLARILADEAALAEAREEIDDLKETLALGADEDFRTEVERRITAAREEAAAQDRERVAQLEAALEFYGDPMTYKARAGCEYWLVPIEQDKGEKARGALAAGKS